MWKGPAWATVLRDLLLLAIGSFGILHEELTGQASIPLLVVYTTLMGVPGAAATLWLGRTGSPSSSPPVDPSPPASPSS